MKANPFFSISPLLLALPAVAVFLSLSFAQEQKPEEQVTKPLDELIGMEWRVRDWLGRKEQEKLLARLLAMASSPLATEQSIAKRAFIELGSDWYAYLMLASDPDKLAGRFELFFEVAQDTTAVELTVPLCAHLTMKALHWDASRVSQLQRQQLIAVVELLLEDLADRKQDSRASAAISMLCDLDLRLPLNGSREELLKAWHESKIYRNLARDG